MDCNDLSGEIPAGLFNLSKLKSIYLFGNNFSGPINDFSNLKKLEFLVLGQNNFSGNITPELFSLKNLIYLNLENNQLSGVIPEFFGGPNFRTIDLVNNNFIGPIPEGFGNTVSLISLQLSNNHFTGTIPDNLSNVHQLQLAENDLSGQIPEEILPFFLQDEKTIFRLSGNHFKPHEQSQAVLDYINTVSPGWFDSQTDFSTMICDRVTSIPLNECLSMEELFLNSDGWHWGNNEGWLLDTDVNSWYGVTVAGGHVKEISLSNNDLSGQFPISIWALEYLEVFNISNNELGGNLPATIGNLGRLQNFDIGQNMLGGVIPVEITTVEPEAGFVLDIGYNRFSPELQNPPVITWLTTYDADWAETQHKEIDENQICKQVVDVTEEACLGLVKLYRDTKGKQWTIQDNWLQSTTVESWYGVTVENGDVVALELPNNNLVGNIPEELGVLAAIHRLDLSSNKLIGNLPTSLSSFTQLEALNLGSNFFSGQISDSICASANLDRLNLENNSFSGNIPACFSEHDNLTALQLNNNVLNGSIFSNGPGLM